MASDTDMSAAWHAHAPPPPPVASGSRSPNKPRRSSSYDPMSAGRSFDRHTQGGVLPPDSFSPEPPRPRRDSASKPSPAPTSASTPSSPTKRHRSKTSSNPAPPAPSALYNYQHQQRQQQQQQQRFQPPQPPYQPPSHYADPSTYTNGHVQDVVGYARTRHDSSPYPLAASTPPQSAYSPVSPVYHQQPLPPQVVQQGYGAPPMAADLQQMGYAAAGWNAYASTHPYSQQQSGQPAGAPMAYAATPPEAQYSVPSSSYYSTPPQQQAATFSNGYVPAHPIQAATSPPPPPATAQPFPSMTPPSMPFSPPPPSDLSRQSTVSSVSSTRRPLPQPSRTSSNPAAVGSPLASQAGSVRRNLPRLPPASTVGPSSGSPVSASLDKLPLSTLNRTESVRMAAEALMARGVPQRRPLRSALANTTFVAPSQSDPTPSGPAMYQSAVEQTKRKELPTQPGNHATAQDELANSFANVSISQAEARRASVPVVAVEEPEVPRRRRGASVSRSRPVSPAPPPVVVEPPPSSVPVINLPGDDDAGPMINVSGPEDDVPQFTVTSDDGPMISVTSDDGPSISITPDDEDDRRSQTSAGSKSGPSISVSFSGVPAAKAQRAGTSQQPGPYSRLASTPGAASSSSVGNGAQCLTCSKYITGKVVHALDTTFHPACFVCAHCSEGLEHVAFYEKDGLPYCHFDYHELFSKRCFHCRTPIVDERFITVQDEELGGRCYHELHFFCANCGDPFLDPKAAGSAAGADPELVSADEDGRVKAGGMEFVVHKGYPYCEKCHINLHKPRCKTCRKPITGDVITALNAKYHADCFVCARCSNTFTDPNFYVSEGKTYDEECYKILLRGMV